MLLFALSFLLSFSRSKCNLCDKIRYVGILYDLAISRWTYLCIHYTEKFTVLQAAYRPHYDYNAAHMDELWQAFILSKPCYGWGAVFSSRGIMQTGLKTHTHTNTHTKVRKNTAYLKQHFDSTFVAFFYHILQTQSLSLCFSMRNMLSVERLLLLHILLRIHFINHIADRSFYIGWHSEIWREKKLLYLS